MWARSVLVFVCVVAPVLPQRNNGARVAAWVRGSHQQHPRHHTAEPAAAAAAVDAVIDEICESYRPTLDLRDLAPQFLSLSESAQGELRRKMRTVLAGKKADFRVAVGGESSCSGLGNYYNETSTAVLDDALQRGFAAAGLRASATNYCMGDARALPFGWCMKEVVRSPDIVTWDYSAIEGAHWEVSEVFARAAWKLESGPMTFWVNEDEDRLAMLNFYSASYGTLRSAEKLVESLPSLKRLNLKHGGGPHSLKFIDRRPRTELEKRITFNTPEGSPGRLVWQPGWRLQRLHGSLFAVSLLTALRDEILTPTEEEEQGALGECVNGFGDEELFCQRALLECATTYYGLSKSGRKLEDFVIGGSWPRVLADAGLHRRSKPLGLGYPEAKWALRGEASDGPLDLRIPAASVTEGFLLLCQAATGWRRPQKMEDLDQVTQVSIDDDGFPGSRALKLERMALVPGCFRARIHPPSSEQQPVDHASFFTLSLNVTTDVNHTDTFVYLSHLIWG